MSGVGRLRFGFIALDDAAPLIVAEAKGFFAQEGLDVELARQVSWATVRDKVAVGALDGAHMLAPTTLATSLGAGGGPPVALVAPLALAVNGPAVTLASRVADLVGEDASAEGLARLVARRREEGASPITLAVVFPFSTHNYLLRDWLAGAGIDPDRDVRLIVAPPSRMAALLTEGVMEGFCVTEPWDTAAMVAGAGVIVARGSQLWPRTPDKVFSVREAWAQAHPEALQAVLRALIRAAAWADESANRAELAAILARPDYVAADADVIARSLTDIVYHADHANCPRTVHAAWLLSQMMRWGHIGAEVNIPQVAERVYRPDLYAVAASTLGLPPAPAVDSLRGYGAAGVYRLQDAHIEAAAAPLSRLHRA
jgi:NitT/TauT family transport system ATP-binding protein/nitrate/nitrite transport system substrate-binding protein